MAYQLLSQPIRKYVRDQGWQQLRPIQIAAIEKILSSDLNYILASPTASGKTEAAFLPILSKVDFNQSGVQLLYISPLIALINDQFSRLELLCEHLDITVTKWHGEANKTLKNKLLKLPNGIVLTTPESLEAMFVNKPFNLKKLFSKLKYIVIDEIHSFIGSDRGVQLQSIVSRLQQINTKPACIIGLSATIGDYQQAKKFTGNELKTKILLDKTIKQVNAVFRYFKTEKNQLPLDLLKDLYIATKSAKVLIFPNSRGRAEEVAVKLKKISNLVNGHPNYFSHHSSVHRETREYVEYFAKNNNQQNFCISCTSTLELGIDIGTVDQVIQIDATHSIASLIQRVGRSGRKDNQTSSLYLYSTNQWSLLQSVACWLLYKEGFIEPPQNSQQPYDILLHQTLSITKEHSSIELSELINKLQQNFAFSQIKLLEIKAILKHLIAIDFLERIQNQVIIGLEGEKLVNSKDFYSVFKTEENFKVINVGNSIGEIPFSPQIVEQENILLSAKIWKIKLIDYKAKKIEVVPANDGRKPIFFGSAIAIQTEIRQKMLEILYQKSTYDFLDLASTAELQSMRNDFSIFNIKQLSNNRPLLATEYRLQLFTFTSTRINRTLSLLLSLAAIKNTLDESNSSFEIETSQREIIAKWHSLSLPLANIDAYIAKLLQAKPLLLDFSKWANYLPEKFKIEILKNKYFDLEQTEQFIKNTQLIVNTKQP